MAERCYVDNAMNRRLGRVGMPLGSCVHSSRSSSRSSSSSGYYDDCSVSTSQRMYVDNSTNRSLGRVGKPVGSHVLHSNGSISVSSPFGEPSPRKTYVDNSVNRSLGRAGKELGSHVAHRDGSITVSSSSFAAPKKAYVNNSVNRSLDRVGKELGSHVAHRDGSITVSSSSFAAPKKAYVDNSVNRSLGRVGKELGSHVAHRDGSITVSSSSFAVPKKTYVDNSVNRSLGRVGGSHDVVYGSGSTSGYSSAKTYADNSMNRSLGRVGKPLGSHVFHKDGTTSIDPAYPSGASYKADKRKPKGSQVVHKDDTTTFAKTSPKACYVDNAYNRKLGRVGQPIVRRGRQQGSRQHMMEQAFLDERSLDEIVHILHGLDFKDPVYSAAVNARYELQRTHVEEDWKRCGISPSVTPTQPIEKSVTPSQSIAKSAIPSRSTEKAKVEPKVIIPLEELIIEFDDKNLIGEGGFGKVYPGLWKKNPIAFKKLIYQQITAKRLDGLVKEIKIFSGLDHINIVKMFGVVVNRSKIGLVMEYLPKTLFHALFIEEFKFSASSKMTLVREIVSALDYLHTPVDAPCKPIIAHCDIKSQNILLDSKNVAKLCDFGLSAMKNSSLSSQSQVAPGQGTPRYAAPEVLQGEILSMSGLLRSDIYSLSLVMYEILVEEEPYEELNIHQLRTQVGEGILRPRLEDKLLTDSIKQLLESAWSQCPRRRPSVHRISEDLSKMDCLIADKQLIK